MGYILVVGDNEPKQELMKHHSHKQTGHMETDEKSSLHELKFGLDSQPGESGFPGSIDSGVGRELTNAEGFIFVVDLDKYSPDELQDYLKNCYYTCKKYTSNELFIAEDVDNSGNKKTPVFTVIGMSQKKPSESLEQLMSVTEKIASEYNQKTSVITFNRENAKAAYNNMIGTVPALTASPAPATSATAGLFKQKPNEGGVKKTAPNEAPPSSPRTFGK